MTPTPPTPAKPGLARFRPDVVPILFGCGGVALAVAGAWLYRNPRAAFGDPGPDAIRREETLAVPVPVPQAERPSTMREDELRVLGERVARLEQAASHPAAPPARQEAPATLDTLRAEVAAARTDAATLRRELDRAATATRWRRAAIRLDEGRPLGDLPSDLPALRAWRDVPPPTVADLRREFVAAADAAVRDIRPGGENSLFRRMVTRIARVVLLRRGDEVIVGDPVVAVLTEARARLDAGDLAACIAAVNRLSGPPATAMAAWRGRAAAMLAARAAILAQDD